MDLSHTIPECMLLYHSCRVVGILKETSILRSFISLLFRHLNMINKELDKLEDTVGKRSSLVMKEEDRQHWDDVKRKLNLHQEVEAVRVKKL